MNGIYEACHVFEEVFVNMSVMFLFMFLFFVFAQLFRDAIRGKGGKRNGH